MRVARRSRCRALPATGKVGVNYSGNLAATTPSGSYTFTRRERRAAAGLDDQQSVWPVERQTDGGGHVHFTLKATRSNGCTGTREYSRRDQQRAGGAGAGGGLRRRRQSDLTLWSGSTGAWQHHPQPRRNRRHATRLGRGGRPDACWAITTATGNLIWRSSGPATARGTSNAAATAALGQSLGRGGGRAGAGRLRRRRPDGPGGLAAQRRQLVRPAQRWRLQRHSLGRGLARRIWTCRCRAITTATA
jgi:hypothetical protein